MIPKSDVAWWSLELALRARLPLWKPESWRLVAGLINTASYLTPINDLPRNRVLRAAAMSPSKLVCPSEPAATWAQQLRRVAQQIVAQSNQPGLIEKLQTDEMTRVAAFWDENVGRHREPFAHWESPAPIAESLNRLVSGDPSIGPPQWFITNYGPFSQVADLGCGDGVLTHYLLHHNPTLKIDAYDISEASLERTRTLAATIDGALERCKPVSINLNRDTLPEQKYDAILATGTLHHIENLDFCLRNIRRALRTEGFLWLNDYTGPPQFQWSDTQMRLANELLSTVPRRWRLRDQVCRFDPLIITKRDPSEAVASQNILSALQAHFEVIKTWPRGGTLLAPIFGSGCLAANMAANEEGAKILAAMFNVEQDLIRAGALPSDSYLFIARPRSEADQLIRETFERNASAFFRIARLGISGDLETWIHLNEIDAFNSVIARDGVAPFPPPALMHRTSSLEMDSEFAAHGAVIVRSLAAVSPEPINSYRSVLDFGVGVGRVARMFKGFDGRYVGVDVDKLNTDWVKTNLTWIETYKTKPRRPLPFEKSIFDAVFGISIFTHMNETDQLFYLDELHRVTLPGARLFLTVAGERALQRAENEDKILQMLSMPPGGLDAARTALRGGSGFCFLRQNGHLTSNSYDYGITFISRDYIERRWSDYFDLETFAVGAIHDFQDVVVLRRGSN